MRVVCWVLPWAALLACSADPPASAGVPVAGAAGFDASATTWGYAGTAAPPSEGCSRVDSVWLVCQDPDVARACGYGECLIEGVCYPSGSTTGDGCCRCRDALAFCVDSPACPSSQLLGKRCIRDSDCSFPGARSELVCRADLTPSSGSIGVCTRPCNRGCPTGTVCVTNMPSERAQATESLCLRPCELGAATDACWLEPRGQLLDSRCIGVAPGALYCL